MFINETQLWSGAFLNTTTIIKMDVDYNFIFLKLFLAFVSSV